MTDLDWEDAARAAGWLPPDEVRLKVWRAHNLNHGETCRWCGAVRVRGNAGSGWWKRSDEPQPHRTFCRFYAGPVKHGYANGHMGSFDFWITCTCGKSYPEHGADGNKQECPDSALTVREPRQPDLTVMPGGEAP